MTDPNVAGPRREGDDLYCSREDLYRILNAEQRVRIAILMVGLRERTSRIAELERQEVIRRFDAMAAAASVEVAALAREQQAAEAQLAALRDGISRAYGIDFARCTFDDETGRIYVHETP